MTTTPIKFEQSPADSLADSFASTPGTLYPSLFDSQDAMDGSEVMTPPFDEDEDNSMFGSIAGTPAPESKPVKKRKSWGQQLPEPKTNLPPRYAQLHIPVKRVITNPSTGSEPRPKMRRSKDGSSEFFATVVQPNHQGSASVPRSSNWSRRR